MKSQANKSHPKEQGRGEQGGRLRVQGFDYTARGWWWWWVERGVRLTADSCGLRLV